MTPRKPKRAKQLGIDDAEYARLLAAQGGHCALCPNVPKRLKKDGTPYRLHVDHDHGSSDHRVRGLLCWKCNDALRTWVTSEWLRAAADYLDGEAPSMTAKEAWELIKSAPIDGGATGEHVSAWRDAVQKARREFPA